MNIRAAIFDVDGTLIDSVDLHAKAWQEALAKFGHEIPYKDVRHQIGKGGDQLLPVFLAKREMEAYGEELEQYRGKLFQRKYMQAVKPFPKVRELFERLKQGGKQIVLASSAKEDELEHYKEMLKIGDLIEGKTSADDAEKSKPHPDIFEAALEKISGVDASEAIAVGDTPYDAEAAGKAGVRSIGVLCGGFPEEELKRAGCVEIYRDPADLLARYEESVFGMRRAA